LSNTFWCIFSGVIGLFTNQRQEGRKRGATQLVAPLFCGKKMKEKMMKEISDLALATYLSTKRHKFRSIKADGKKLVFIFEDSELIEKDILAFYNRETSVDALTFSETLRNLKALVLHC
jgi:hypothetical protein